MITVLVLSRGRVEALVATLAAVIPAIPEGLVADAVILTDQPCREVEMVADGVGAAHAVVPPDGDPWRAGAILARRDWVLCLEEGDVPQQGWIAALDRFISSGSPDRRFGRFRNRGSMRFIRIFALGRLWPGYRVRGGDLLRRDLLLGEERSLRRPADVSADLWRDPASSRSD